MALCCGSTEPAPVGALSNMEPPSSAKRTEACPEEQHGSGKSRSHARKHTFGKAIVGCGLCLYESSL